MMYQNNAFKKAVSSLTTGDEPILASPDKELTQREKARLQYQTKMYILLQEIVQDIEKDLGVDEEIVGYLPFTNEENSAIGTAGPMGMTYTKTTQAKKYRDTFIDLRGNRLLIFTNERMLFMVIIEFLVERLYTSFPYEVIKGIRLEEHQMKYFDWSSSNRKFLPTRKKLKWFTLDFQANEHVFTESLNQHDWDRFEKLIAEIPALKNITIDDKVHRNSKFDYFFSNIKLAQRLFVGFWIFVIIAFIIVWIYQFTTNNGLW